MPLRWSLFSRRTARTGCAGSGSQMREEAAAGTEGDGLQTSLHQAVGTGPSGRSGQDVQEEFTALGRAEGAGPV